MRKRCKNLWDRFDLLYHSTARVRRGHGYASRHDDWNKTVTLMAGAARASLVAEPTSLLEVYHAMRTLSNETNSSVFKGWKSAAEPGLLRLPSEVWIPEAGIAVNRPVPAPQSSLRSTKRGRTFPQQ
jgi:hypothetical protein